MDITHRKARGVDIVALSGRFDAAEVPMLAQWFDSHPNTRYVVVNLKYVSFIDSSGLSMLVKGLKRCRQNGGDLYLCGLQPGVVIIFELTRLDKAFHIFDDESAAVTAITI